MIYFRNDYSTGAHPAVLEALVRENSVRSPGYGCDPLCEAAADTIRALCAAPAADVHFLVGGTQVNATAIAAFLRPYEAVIAAESGHVCVHEAGAIEHGGHKVIACPTPDGKLTPEILNAVCAAHSTEHMVAPRLVYISNTTEVGTVYRLEELRRLRAACDQLGLLLYCDGARLGAAITAEGSDAGFADYAAVCDAFTIGGTKNGLLFGEALVIANPALQPAFRFYMKQQGAVLAKGWLLGVQFSALLKDDLYLKLAAVSNHMAAILAKGLAELGMPPRFTPESNMIFLALPKETAKALESSVAFEYQGDLDQSTVCIRLVAGWYTTEEDVASLLALLKEAQL